MKRSAALAIVSSPVEAGGDTMPMRPRTRAECIDGPRPCPWFGCVHHLAVDVNAYGALVVTGGPELPRDPTDADLETFTDAAIARASSAGSCVLDRVRREPDGTTLQVIARVLDVTRERIRQIERSALRPLGPRIRRRFGRVLEAHTPDPTPTSALAKVGR